MRLQPHVIHLHEALHTDLENLKLWLPGIVSLDEFLLASYTRSVVLNCRVATLHGATKPFFSLVLPKFRFYQRFINNWSYSKLLKSVYKILFLSNHYIWSRMGKSAYNFLSRGNKRWRTAVFDYSTIKVICLLYFYQSEFTIERSKAIYLLDSYSLFWLLTHRKSYGMIH